MEREEILKQSFQKMARYCAYQERCEQEIRLKLGPMNLGPDEQEAVLHRLREENFLNETRYAQAYASGKFRLKKWGIRKIVNELKKRKLSPSDIQTGLKEIDPEAYRQTLLQLAQAKWDKLGEQPTLLLKQQKVQRYLLQKGYEPDRVHAVIRTYFSP